MITDQSDTFVVDKHPGELKCSPSNSSLMSFLALKYQLPTSDNFSRNNQSKCKEILNQYPKEVVANWAWRCAEDVEHLVKGHKEVEEFIRVAKLFRFGKATKEELDKAWNAYAASAAYY